PVQAFVRGCEPEPFRGLQGPEGLFRAFSGPCHVSRRRWETVAPQEFPGTCPLNRPHRCAGSNLPPSVCQIAYLQRRCVLVPVLAPGSWPRRPVSGVGGPGSPPPVVGGRPAMALG